MTKQSFPAKILLFGEYAVLRGGKALSVPYHKYSGFLDIPISSTKKSKKSNALLKGFVDSLKSKDIDIDFHKVDRDVSCGISFVSTIPSNYGLGSSGALVAAFYSKYFDAEVFEIHNWSDTKIKKVQSQLATLESHFHGQSSGIDPLVCLFGKPIVYHDHGTEVLSQNHFFEGNFFLIDTKLSSNTQKWVTKMIDLLNDSTFESHFKQRFIYASNLCIDSFLGNESRELIKHIKTLSQTTLDLLDFLIPESFIDFWIKGMETDSYYLKLCGSGGGGYLLGYTDDWIKLKSIVRDYKIEPIFSTKSL